MTTPRTTLRLLAALALLSVWLVLPDAAHAQTTTSTSSSTTTTASTSTTTSTSLATTTSTSTTSTTLITTQVITGCHVLADQPLGSGYHVAGVFTGAAAYRTDGMVFGIPNTMKAAGKCLCNSVARIPMTVIFNTSAGTMFEPAPYAVPAGTRPTSVAVKAFSAAGTEVVNGTPLNTLTIEFWSVCK